MDDEAAPDDVPPDRRPAPGAADATGTAAGGLGADDVDMAPLAPTARRDIWVLALAVGVFGMSFGVLATTAGLTVAQACVMSLLVFTGASQFAAVGVLEAGGSLGSAFGSALLLAARNAAYGVAMAPTLSERSLGRRLLAAQLVIDESTAMAMAQPGRRAREHAFWTTGLAIFACWNAATFFGALAGDAIGDPEALGLDAAFPAGYVALVVPHLRSRQGQLAAVGGVLISLVLIPLAPAGLPIVAAALGVIPAVLFVRPARGAG
jgi:4-azaleucine resistance transporter AzlC